MPSFADAWDQGIADWAIGVDYFAEALEAAATDAEQADVLTAEFQDWLKKFGRAG